MFTISIENFNPPEEYGKNGKVFKTIMTISFEDKERKIESLVKHSGMQVGVVIGKLKSSYENNKKQLIKLNADQMKILIKALEENEDGDIYCGNIGFSFFKNTAVFGGYKFYESKMKNTPFLFSHEARHLLPHILRLFYQMNLDKNRSSYFSNLESF